MSALDTILAEQKITHDLVQGTPEWLAFRVEHDGASEAAAMLGLSKKVGRNELLRVKHTGIAREFSDFIQTHILDKGHELEALARPHVEAQIGEDLYPATCSRGRLSASCDGITLDDSTAFEHKQWNEALAASVRAGVVPDEHMPQCQQIMLVTGAQRVLFVVSDGTPENMVSIEVAPDDAWWERIAAGWEQFHIDLTTYVPTEATPAAVAAPIEALPAVSVRMDGSLKVIDNLDVFGAALRAFVQKIPAKPTSEQEFADCDAACKALKRAEETLTAAESSALASMADVEKMRRIVGDLSKLAKTTRLATEKLVEARKDQIRLEEVTRGRDGFARHIASLNERLGRPYMPAIAHDFPGAIKGKRTIPSLKEAVDSHLAALKIHANAIADKVQVNLNWLRENAEDHKFLFSDVATIVLKDPEDLKTLATLRINEHKAAEARKEEEQRERIREEEAAKLRREQEARDREAARVAAEAAKPAATPPPAPIASPALSTKPQAANSPSVVPITRGAATLRIGEIANRLGLGVTEAFLRQLGFAPATKQGASCLYHEESFDLICEALVAHVRTVQAKQHEAVAA